MPLPPAHLPIAERGAGDAPPSAGDVRANGRSTPVAAALGWVLAAVLLPLGIAAAVLLVVQWQDARDAALGSLQREAQALQLNLDRELSLDLAVLQTLAASLAAEQQDWSALHAAAVRAATVRPGSVVTGFLPDGRNVVNSSVPPGQALPNVFQRPPEGWVAWQGRQLPLPPLALFAEPFKTGRPAFSGVVWGRISQRPVVATHWPVQRDGKVVLVMGLSYGADVHAALLASTPSAPGTVRAIVDGHGLVLARQPGHASFVGQPAPAPFAAGGASLPAHGTGRSTSLDGADLVFAHSRSAVCDWTVVVGLPREQVFAPAWRTLWRSLLALAVAAALGSLVAARLARRLAGPLRQLAAQVLQPGAAGAGGAAAAVQGSGIAELDTLAGALAQASRLQGERDTLAQEREQAREALRGANAQLQHANQQKDDFIGVLSHELRNPLAPIRHALYLLDRVDASDPLAVRARQVIDRQVGHMTSLVDDLLDVTRIARGRLTLRWETLDLCELLRGMAVDYRELLAQRGVQLVVHTPATPLWLRADPTRLAQVVGNLLDNAGKFTPAGGEVSLRAETDGTWVLLHVLDTGAGIDPGQLAAVFEPFVQGAQGLARGSGGLGLGLAIVQGVLALHGGQVQAFSAGPGRGSRFTVRLPPAAAHPEPPPAGERRQQARPPAGRRTVLVVEDLPDVARALCDMVGLLGHQTLWAADGLEALRLHAEHAPDTVLCDLGLPGISGYEVARRLRATGSRARLFALSGYARPDDVQRALEAGFEAHVAKPADPERILALLGRGDAVARDADDAVAAPGSAAGA